MAEHLYDLMKKKLEINGQELENEEDQSSTYDEMSVFIKMYVKKEITSLQEYLKVVPTQTNVENEFFKKVENLKKYFK